jgi:3-deoxy-7-phosphoheptulonate synthase
VTPEKQLKQLSGIWLREALHQPGWSDAAQAERARATLAARLPLVGIEGIRALRSRLAAVAAGEALVVQAGDCAEDPKESTLRDVLRKSAVLDLLGGALSLATGRQVLRAGRIGGQFAKPRSRATERVGNRELPSYRGHLVNGPEPNPEARRPDPLRLLTGYMAAGDIMEHLGWRGPAHPNAGEPRVWTSHEALVLDYELPMIRQDHDGTLFLTSTHWPWIGERTRQADGAHVALAAEIGNPVACKVGPATNEKELLALCERLDREREPGRLTLVARMGADAAADRLPPLVAAVRAAGHPVIWLCDPMHGNTVTTPQGRKTRLVTTVRREVRAFRQAVAAAGGVAGGLHLETTPDDVTECADDESGLAHVGDRYTTLCDPRLTPWQALSVVAAWNG